MRNGISAENNSSSMGKRVRLGAPELRGSGISELTLISEVNESIKQAIRASESISLIAVNANLAAGRSGAKAVGFCVVAGELRMFSERMANTMHGWSSLIYELVQETARSSNQLHNRTKLRETSAQSAKAGAALAQALARSDEAFAIAKARNSERVIELQGLMRRAAKQRVTGEVIARSAMIESAYGGTMQPVLQQIAKAIDASVGKLTSHVRDVGQITGMVAV